MSLINGEFGTGLKVSETIPRPLRPRINNSLPTTYFGQCAKCDKDILMGSPQFGEQKYYSVCRFCARSHFEKSIESIKDYLQIYEDALKDLIENDKKYKKMERKAKLVALATKL